jgi:hypothetical protein
MSSEKFLALDGEKKQMILVRSDDTLVFDFQCQLGRNVEFG